jgi:hypothetical protein
MPPNKGDTSRGETDSQFMTAVGDSLPTSSPNHPPSMKEAAASRTGLRLRGPRARVVTDPIADPGERCATIIAPPDAGWSRPADRRDPLTPRIDTMHATGTTRPGIHNQGSPRTPRRGFLASPGTSPSLRPLPRLAARRRGGNRAYLREKLLTFSPSGRERTQRLKANAPWRSAAAASRWPRGLRPNRCSIRAVIEVVS